MSEQKRKNKSFYLPNESEENSPKNETKNYDIINSKTNLGKNKKEYYSKEKYFILNDNQTPREMKDNKRHKRNKISLDSIEKNNIREDKTPNYKKIVKNNDNSEKNIKTSININSNKDDVKKKYYYSKMTSKNEKDNEYGIIRKMTFGKINIDKNKIFDKIKEKFPSNSGEKLEKNDKMNKNVKNKKNGKIPFSAYTEKKAKKEEKKEEYEEDEESEEEEEETEEEDEEEEEDESEEEGEVEEDESDNLAKKFNKKNENKSKKYNNNNDNKTKFINNNTNNEHSYSSNNLLKNINFF